MILADEHISVKMIAAIKAIPLETISVKEKFKGADDDRIIEFARENDLVIITEDKDFASVRDGVKSVSLVEAKR